MLIERLEVTNLRAFEQVDISFNDYTCFVGPNSAGKSTALCALNIFFRQSEDINLNLQSLEEEDFHNGNTADPIKIRVTFGQLSEEAQSDFRHYVRGGKLIVTASAEFDPQTRRAVVRHFGERLGFQEFRPFFEKLSAGAKADELNNIYSGLLTKFEGLPKANSKEAKATALQEYEAARQDKCVSIPSEDQFYGVSRGANRLERHIQWVYVPAVKDAFSEQADARNSAFAKLLARAVSAKTEFEAALRDLRETARSEYARILQENQPALERISDALNARLAEWAHPKANLKIEWQEDDQKSIRIEEPLPRVKVSEGALPVKLRGSGTEFNAPL